MSKVHKDLKRKYGRVIPRPNEVIDKKAIIGELKGAVQQESRFLATLHGKMRRPKGNFAEAWRRLRDGQNPCYPERPKFHVAAKNYPIPEPAPSRYGTLSMHPLFRNGRYIQLRQLVEERERAKKASEPQQIEIKKAKAKRLGLVGAFYKIRKQTRIVFGMNCKVVKELDNLTKVISGAIECREGWKRKYAHLQKRQYENGKAKQEAREMRERIVNQPHGLREENRELRQKLMNLEAELVERKEERRKLRLRDGEGFEGPCVTELRKNKSMFEKMEKKILDYAKERKEAHSTMEIITNGLSDHISGLIETNGHVFPKAQPTYQAQADADAKNNNVTAKPLFVPEEDYNGNVVASEPLYNIYDLIDDIDIVDPSVKPRPKKVVKELHPDPSDVIENENELPVEYFLKPKLFFSRNSRPRTSL